MDTYLEDQIEAANLSNEQLSLIMVDIDHYKVINDNFGHTAGDYALTLFSGIIIKCTRKTDLVARFGGDEFIVILPTTDLVTAKFIAERIRQTVAETHIPPLDGVNIPSFTCSLGISTFPLHCDNKRSLIKTADIAMYKAKQSGRNCTVIYEKEFNN